MLRLLRGPRYGGPGAQLHTRYVTLQAAAARGAVRRLEYPAIEMAYAERFQATFTRTPAGYIEDVGVMTCHFSTPSDGPLGDTIRGTVESAFRTMISTLVPVISSYVTLTQFRWYDQRVAPTHSPLLRTATPTAVVGTSSNLVMPQMSMSLTMETDTRSRWGRMYLVGYCGTLTSASRSSTSGVDSACTAFKTWLDACKSAGAVPVVWSPKGGVGPPAFAPGTYQPVVRVRVDDIPDVIRSRRWQSSPYRKILALA